MSCVVGAWLRYEVGGRGWVGTKPGGTARYTRVRAPLFGAIEALSPELGGVSGESELAEEPGVASAAADGADERAELAAECCSRRWARHSWIRCMISSARSDGSVLAQLEGSPEPLQSRPPEVGNDDGSRDEPFGLVGGSATLGVSAPPPELGDWFSGPTGGEPGVGTIRKQVASATELGQETGTNALLAGGSGGGSS